MNPYKQLKETQQNEVNNFPIQFAFSQSQFNEAMEKLGLQPNETEKVVSIGAGSILLKTDLQAYKDMYERHEQELEQAIEDDPTGENFVYYMFRYELNNHEYSYTRQFDDTLQALGLTYDEVKNNTKLYKGLRKASDEILNSED